MMMKSLLRMSVVVVVCASGGNTHAAFISWANTPGSDWNTGSNWNGGVVPGSNDIAYIGSSNTSVPEIVGVVAGVKELQVADGSNKVAALDIRSQIAVGGAPFSVARGTNSIGTVTFYPGAGTTTSSWILWMSRGVTGSTSQINLNGGTLDVGGIQWGDLSTNTMNIDIEGEGTLVVGGDKTGLDWHTTSGLITAYDGSGIVNATFVGGKTYYTAEIPEPNSIALCAVAIVLIGTRRPKLAGATRPPCKSHWA